MINNAIDIYQIYYSDDVFKSQPYENEPPEMKIVNDYLDQSVPKREVERNWAWGKGKREEGKMRIFLGPTLLPVEEGGTEEGVNG